jgi:hypothetical protein
MNKTLKLILIGICVIAALIATWFVVDDIISDSVAKDRAAFAQWKKNRSYQIPLHR